ncbi:MAG TPA: hypothetical protein PK079_14630 [Leptospiraceae bacterium]|nr:hypothetical protein [Leptospiraceae bacterium]HMX34365.1 hypothetical protein [Leptospiraceae bacterium]HMY30312.1 hypothetical protein [Leptospiraceae bacterium]HMZ63665.1 hypothetical protein [Leptospiraceae bacterium]HNA08508.1 hypothetical protein [Leptospiraceae bacterium]
MISTVNFFYNQVSKNRIIFSFILLSFFLLGCKALSTKKKDSVNQTVHLVLNSTGYATEFCIFEVQKQENQSYECKAEKPLEYSRCVEYFADNTSYANLTPRETLDQIYKGLAELELARPSLKNRIKSVGYISSGSFNTAKPNESKQVLKEVEDYFISEKLNVKSKLLTGDEEAKLTLKEILSKENISSAALLQIGTDTIEVITESNRESKVPSAKVGYQTFLEEISTIKPGINACRQPISSFFKSESSSFDRCKQFLLENMSKPNKISSIGKTKLNQYEEVFATGALFNYYYPNKNDLTLDELNSIGREYCSLTIDEIQKKGIKKKNAYNLCYAVSYTSTLIEYFEIKKLKILPKEIYLKKLATSQTLFPEFCK